MKEEKLFHRALDQPADQRASFVAAACGDDVHLRERVEVLLRAHAEPGSFLNAPAHSTSFAATVNQMSLQKPGDSIGPYKLLEQVGEGGMGAVFVAEQTEPVRRKVALKVIKPGMDTAHVVARFEAERQALALMNHPNIAKVLDAGATDSGRPYFVMELVRGVPVTDYCDQHKLDVRQRLELFTTICQAVQHAHQKGVIHRDLKPSNVLVELHDVRAVPKVIDFGVAKATHQQLTRRTLHTGLTQMIGTPTYMSPEQAQLSGLDVDTRSDIYSLGVLLYELLTGTTPLESNTLREAGFDEMRRMIREDDPPRPSERVTTMAAGSLSTVSQRRQSEPQHYTRHLKGELDWIVMRALEKDRARRYESASAFAADVERFLADEPVVACPPSAGYKLRKFARRNQTAFIAATLVAVSLILGIVGLGVSALLIAQERDVSQTERVKAEKQRDRADRLRAQAVQQQQAAEENFRQAREAVDRYLTKVSENELLSTPGLQPLRRDLLELALKYYQDFISKRGNDPKMQAELASAHYRVGDIRSELGDAKAALLAHQTALTIRQSLHEKNHAAPEFRHALAESHIAVAISGKAIDEMIVDIDTAIELATPLEDAAQRVTLAHAYFHLGAMKKLQFVENGVTKRMEESRVALERAAEIFEQLRGELPANQVSDLVSTYMELAAWHRRMGNKGQVSTYHQRALEVGEDLAKQDPKNLTLQEKLAGSYWNVGEREKAITMIATLAEENPAVSLYQRRLADAYLMQGWDEKSLPKLREANTIFKRLQTNDSNGRYAGEVGKTSLALGRILLGNGQHEDAIAAFESAIGSLKELDHSQGVLVDSYIFLSRALDRSGNLTDSIAAQREGVKVIRELSEQSPKQLHRRQVLAGQTEQLGKLLRRAGRTDEALATHRAAVDALQPLFAGGQTPDDAAWKRDAARRQLASLQQKLADLLASQDLHGEAASCYSRAIELDPESVALWESRARLRFHLDQTKEGLSDLGQALVLTRAAVKADPNSGKQWNLWKQIALAYYRRQDWQGAGVEADLAVELAADRPGLMMGIVPLYLLAGKENEYEAVCGQLVSRWQEWTGDDLGCAAAMCALAPNPPADSEMLMRLMRRAVDEGPEWSINFLHLAELRNGDHQKAIRAMESRSGWARKRLVLAIAYHRVGREAEARSYLSQVLETWDETEPQHADPRIVREALRHEAERSISRENTSTNSEPEHDHAIQ